MLRPAILFFVLTSCHLRAAPEISNAAPALVNETEFPAKQAGWNSLLEAPIPEGSIEIRIWSFGDRPPTAIRIKRDYDRWSATSLGPENLTPRERAPRSGWGKAWKRLLETGLLVLPDSSKLGGYRAGLDGTSYLVEFHNGELYRSYSYSNPQLQTLPEANSMLGIVEILHDEFGITEPF